MSVTCRWSLALLCTVALAVLDAHAAQPGPPQITQLIVNGGANLTTADQVTVEFRYTHPAAPGAPIAYYRVRVKPPGGNHLQWGRYFDANGRNSVTVALFPGHPSPPGGIYEIQVQIQDSGGRYSNVATGHVMRASPTPSTLPPPVEYRVRAADIPALIGFARQRGYLNTAAPMNTGAQCTSRQNGGFWHLRVQKTVVPVPGATEYLPTPTCEFGFFKGKNLQFGWKYKAASFEGWATQPANWAPYGPAPAGLSAAFAITVTGTGALAQGEVRMTELILEGPPGSRWQDAFKP